MPGLPALFPAAFKRGLRNIYQLYAEHFPAKWMPGLPQENALP
jgi:hypothetical protein